MEMRRVNQITLKEAAEGAVNLAEETADVARTHEEVHITRGIKQPKRLSFISKTELEIKFHNG